MEPQILISKAELSARGRYLLRIAPLGAQLEHFVGQIDDAPMPPLLRPLPLGLYLPVDPLHFGRPQLEALVRRGAPKRIALEFEQVPEGRAVHLCLSSPWFRDLFSELSLLGDFYSLPPVSVFGPKLYLATQHSTFQIEPERIAPIRNLSATFEVCLFRIAEIRSASQAWYYNIMWESLLQRRLYKQRDV